MAGFCHYWRITPAEYYALTVEQASAMHEWMSDERKPKKRAPRRRR